MIPILDLRLVSAQVRLTHAAADGFADADGVRIVLRSNGMDPARPQPLEPSAEAFVVGAVDPFTEAVLRLNRGGRNVWISPVVYPGGLGDEPIGVIGFGVELAGEAAEGWLQRLPFPPTALLRAIVSATAIYLLDKPANADQLGPVADHVARLAGGVVAEVWPIAGSVHYPASGAPELVQLALPWQAERYSLDQLQTAIDAGQRRGRVRFEAVDPEEAGDGVDPEEAGAGVSPNSSSLSGDDDVSAGLCELELYLKERWRRLEFGSDVELSQRLARELIGRFGQVVYAEGAFWLWGGTHWAELESEAARRLLHAFDGAVYPTPGGRPERVRLSKFRVDSALRELAAILARQDFFAAPAEGINAANGFIVFDPEDGTPSLIPHQREHRCRHTLPGRFDRWVMEMAEDPPEDSLLYKLLFGAFQGDADADDKRRLIGEIGGNSALGRGTRLRQPKAFVFDGDRANNGKSQFLDLLRGTLPATAASALSASKFGDERYIVHLRGKLLNAPDEMSSAAVIASDIFKQVVTGEPVSGRDVYKSVVTFRPTAQHVFASNVLPSFTGGFDRGVQRRLGVVRFERVIPDDQQIEDLGKRIGREEPDLALAFIVAGARRLLKNGKFTEPASCRRALVQWLYAGDPVLGWMRARLRRRDEREFLPGHKDAGIRSSDAHRDFVDWAGEIGYRKNTLPNINAFIRRVHANADWVRVKHTNVGGRLTGCVIEDQVEVVDEEEE
jgi:phage/plasmid-associated DNA primase